MGRLGFQQYIRNKPTKWGIKVFVLADAYVKNLQIYTGKSVDDDGNASIGQCSKVVIDLIFDPHHTGGIWLVTVLPLFKDWTSDNWF